MLSLLKFWSLRKSKHKGPFRRKRRQLTIGLAVLGLAIAERRATREQSGAFGTGWGVDTITPSWVLQSAGRCYRGTIEKSASYENSGAGERRSGD